TEAGERTGRLQPDPSWRVLRGARLTQSMLGVRGVRGGSMQAVAGTGRPRNIGQSQSTCGMTDRQTAHGGMADVYRGVQVGRVPVFFEEDPVDDAQIALRRSAVVMPRLHQLDRASQ